MGKYLGDFVYGANDGIITTLAVVSGASGASLPEYVVVIMGFANLFADGISMGASNFLGTKSEGDYAKAQRDKEVWKIDNQRVDEIEKLRNIYIKKGFTGEALSSVIENIIKDKKVWVDTIINEELGIVVDKIDDPRKHAFATFIAFVCAGFIPLLPYTFSFSNQFNTSIIIGASTLFIVGSLRSIVTSVGWFRGGIEMLGVGSLAAITAYGIGISIEGLIAR